VRVPDIKPNLEHSQLLQAGDRGCFKLRYLIAFLITLAIFVVYILRVILSVGIISIVEINKWDDDLKGLILSSFYWGYITTQLPSIWLIDRFGAKMVLAVGICVASVFTIVVPWVYKSAAGLIAVRVLTGVFEGVSFPAIYGLAGEWVPKPEKSLTMAIFQAASAIGTAASLGIGPFVVTKFGWAWCFYGCGALGILWTVPWLLFVTRSPQDESSFTLWKISFEEKHYIMSARDKAAVEHEVGLDQDVKKEKTPWFEICTHSAILVLMWNHFACNWGTYVFISWLPTYLKEVLHYDMNSLGMLYSIVPYLTQPVIGILSGTVVDNLVKRNLVSLVTLRKFFQCATCFISASCLVVLAFTDLPDVGRLVLVLSVISLFGFANGAGYTCNYLDLSGTHAAAIMGLSNMFATIPGIAGVYLTGFLKAKTGNYNASFLLAASIYVTALYSFMVWGRAEQIDFHPPPKEPLINDMKTRRPIPESE
jgi:ACS family sodium-dependent inorganic phosphate cotransporter